MPQWPAILKSKKIDNLINTVVRQKDKSSHKTHVKVSDLILNLPLIT